MIHPPICAHRPVSRVGTAALLLAVAATLAAAGCGPKASEGIVASGTIEATEAQVAAKVAGVLTGVLPAEGDPVDSAQVLARVDDAGLRWQLAQAEAARDLAQAHMDMAVNGPRAEELAAARAAVAQAAAQERAARADRERAESLAATGTATGRQLDEARARAATAAAALDQARAAVDLLEAGTRPEQLAAARAQVAQTVAQLGAAQRRLADCVVRSPFAGVITHRLMEPGEMAAPGSAVVTVTRLDPVQLRVYLTEVEVGRIRLGQPVEVFLDATPQAALAGQVSYISPVAEFTPKNVQTRQDRVKLVFAVEVTLGNANGQLKPGLPADAVFEELSP